MKDSPLVSSRGLMVNTIGSPKLNVKRGRRFSGLSSRSKARTNILDLSTGSYTTGKVGSKLG